ncbi:diguanylate cyclase [Candidatus Oscillochloris fontis]|uniref:diguanylate cyclase n=1 Tax=Candidatus Oscillochloris fontis TaxID=2496868 RepID=UPI0013763FE6|nr:diguanylate cyclase [Candidatus Oscillochloris fontis]
MPFHAHSISPQIAAIRMRYIQQLEDRAQAISALWQHGIADGLSSDQITSLYAQAHTLAGSAGSFNLPEVSEVATHLENLFAHLNATGVQNMPSEMQAMITVAITQLIDVAHQVGDLPIEVQDPLPIAIPVRKQEQTPVLIVEDDVVVGEHLALQLEHFGYCAMVVQQLDDLEQAVRTHHPAAIILDIVFPEGDLAGPQRIATLLDPTLSVPVVFVSQRNDFEARLWALRAGGRAYLTKPSDVDALVMVLDGLTGAFIPEPYRVLILDDSRLMSSLYAAMLEEAGMLTMVLNDPAEVMFALHEFQPDLLLLDMYMPICTGPEVAAIIRQQTEFVSLPIVFLSGEQDRDHQLAALDQGGDDFLTKPITAPQLVSAVTSRARRGRAMRAQLTRDGLTGLFTHASIKEQLVREIMRAQRYEQILSVAMIDIDHFKQINDHYGHAAGDRVLKGLARLLHQRLRMSDTIGRYGGEEFLLIFPQTDGPTALRVLDDARARFAMIGHQFGKKEVTITFSGGIAALRRGDDPRTLLAIADDALYTAKRAGRNQIICAPRHPRSTSKMVGDT